MLQFVVQKPRSRAHSVGLQGEKTRCPFECSAHGRILLFGKRIHQHVHGAAVQPVVRLHASGPFAMPPSAILALASQNRQKQLLLEQAVKPLATGQFKAAQDCIKGMRIIFRADLPVFWPIESVVVHMAVDQMKVDIRWPLVKRMRTPKEEPLRLNRKKTAQLVDHALRRPREAP